MEGIKFLSRLVNDEREKIKSTFMQKDAVNKQLLLMELVRSIDIFYLSVNEDNAMLNALYQYGWNEILSLVFSVYVNKEKYPLSYSTKESREWAHSLIQHCGKIAFCKKIMAFCNANLAQIKCDEGNNFYVDFYDVRDWEQFDREAFGWFQTFVRTHLSEPEIRKLEKNFPRIQKSLITNVNTWKNHFIQYTTS